MNPVRIAHLTDLHLDGSPGRRERLRRALSEARGLGAQHLLLTGDLTAFGTEAQCAELAGVLETDWPARWGLGKTVVAGNHDGWGPIDRLFPTPPPADLGAAVILPVDTRFHRRALAFRALGAVGKEALRTIGEVTRDPRRPVVIAMHHGPHGHALGMFEGLVGRKGLGAILDARPHVHVCCGHDHERKDRGNVHIAPAVAHDPRPLRLYDVGPAGFQVR